jgi:hypothetical protein
MRILTALACTVMLMGVAVVPGYAEKRVSLVMENSQHKNAGTKPKARREEATPARRPREGRSGGQGHRSECLQPMLCGR